MKGVSSTLLLYTDYCINKYSTTWSYSTYIKTALAVKIFPDNTLVQYVQCIIQYTVYSAVVQYNVSFCTLYSDVAHYNVSYNGTVFHTVLSFSWVRLDLFHLTSRCQLPTVPLGVSYLPLGVSYLPLGVSYLPLGVSYLPLGVSYLPLGVWLQ